jgi:hypothetical protein
MFKETGFLYRLKLLLLANIELGNEYSHSYLVVINYTKMPFPVVPESDHSGNFFCYD